jgi:hypothetical protein
MRTKLRERVAQLVSDVDHDRLEQEIAILAQRLDVDEEIDRLRGHVTEVRKTFDGKEPAGGGWTSSCKSSIARPTPCHRSRRTSKRREPRST